MAVCVCVCVCESYLGDVFIEVYSTDRNTNVPEIQEFFYKVNTFM